ncbi:hypothetical protein NMD96_12875 [Edwardsiella tarda]|uniref:hypothetical protein n=1 Tax=Edwardsiella tarda TaxID=636 RepID=UPI00351C5DB9
MIDKKGMGIDELLLSLSLNSFMHLMVYQDIYKTNPYGDQLRHTELIRSIYLSTGMVKNVHDFDLEKLDTLGIFSDKTAAERAAERNTIAQNQFKNFIMGIGDDPNGK